MYAVHVYIISRVNNYIAYNFYVAYVYWMHVLLYAAGADLEFAEGRG